MKFDSDMIKNAISVERMRLSDEYTIADFTDSKTLMYRAAKGIYDSCKSFKEPVLIVTGSGNNAGDGYALAIILANNGIQSTLVRLSDKFSDDGKYYYEKAVSCGVKDSEYSDDMDFGKYGTIVDCIFGTGFKGEPKGKTADAIRKINSSGAYVVCADINSGLNGDTGKAHLAVHSDLTVSVGFPKKGMFLADAPGLIGELVNVDIGIILL